MHRAQKAPASHLGTEQAQLVLTRARELEVVHAHDLESLRVHDLLVQDIARQQQFIGLQIREAHIGVARFEVHAFIVHVVDVLAPADHERRLARPLEGERRHMRKDLARGDAEVVHNSELLSVHIENG